MANEQQLKVLTAQDLHPAVEPVQQLCLISPGSGSSRVVLLLQH
jgi:hypothetical protein